MSENTVDQRSHPAATPLPENPVHRAAMARDPKTPPEHFQALATDPVFFVRYAVAISRLTPPDVLTEMLRDPHPYVRAALAHNPQTPNGLVAILKADPDPDVRAVAKLSMEQRIHDALYGPFDPPPDRGRSR